MLQSALEMGMSRRRSTSFLQNRLYLFNFGQAKASIFTNCETISLGNITRFDASASSSGRSFPEVPNSIRRFSLTLVGKVGFQQRAMAIEPPQNTGLV